MEASKSTAEKVSKATQKWFQLFLKRNAAKGVKRVDFAAVEKKHGITLPRDYQEFITKCIVKSFKNVNGLEVTLTTVLPPNKLDFKEYRRGKNAGLDSEDAKVDGVMFAATDFGDCYLFDVSIKGGDYPVYWWRHEENTLEPYTSNFAECIKRFVQKN